MLSVLMKLPLLSLTARLAPDLLVVGGQKKKKRRWFVCLAAGDHNDEMAQDLIRRHGVGQRIKTHTLIWVLLIRYCSG